MQSKFWIKPILAIVLIATSIISVPGIFTHPIDVVSAETVAELRAQIQKTNAEKAKIEAEIEEYKKQIAETGEEKSTLANKIKSLEITQKKLSADISLTQKKIESANLTITEIGNEIDATENAIAENYSAIKKIIREINYSENISTLELLLTYNSFSEVWNAVGSLEQLQNGLRAKIANLEQVKIAYNQQKQEYESTKRELLDLKDELGDRKNIIDSNKKEQSSLLSQTQSKESEYKKILAEKQALKEKFEKELFEFENQIQFLLDPSKIPTSGSGVLLWTVADVRITQRFGVTSDSGRLYASGSHNGVDFGVPVGTKVLSAAAGVVMGTGDTDVGSCQSYGKWILVKHTNGLISLYGHLSLVSVKEGATVTRGQTIGYSGNTGYSTGPHLHFTVFAPDGVEVLKLADWYKEQSGVTSKSACAVAGISIPVANPKAYLDPLLYL